MKAQDIDRSVALDAAAMLRKAAQDVKRMVFALDTIPHQDAAEHYRVSAVANIDAARTRLSS